MSIMKSSEILVRLYNKIVDVYEYYKTQFDGREASEEDVVKNEDSLMRTLQNLTKQEKLLEIIKGSKLYSVIYNSMVDLFNRYSGRQELRNALKQIERKWIMLFLEIWE